jgi:subtilisin family serine protease
MKNDHGDVAGEQAPLDRIGIEAISEAQFENVKYAAEADGIFLESDPPTGAPHYVWRKDHIKVRGDISVKSPSVLRDLGAELVGTLDSGKDVAIEERINLLKLKSEDGRNTRDDVIKRLAAEGIDANLDRLMYIAHTDGANICPADEPTPVRPYPQAIPYPRARGGNAGQGIRITVIDNGLSENWQVGHPWLWDGDRQPPTEVSGDLDPRTYGPGNLIQQDSGHGTFIAGIIRCVAPRATVKVTNTMRWFGGMTEFQVAQAILAELNANEPPDIINLSGGYLLDETSGAGPSAMLAVMNRLRQPDCQTLLVAAAGNDGTGDHRFYPAGFAAVDPFASEDLVVAVGALRQDRTARACFSNWGDWVTLYEDGERLVNAFPNGKFAYREPLSRQTPPRCVYHPTPPWADGCTCVTAAVEGTKVFFHGMATWSGTSFATPIVVGRVARHMTEHSQFTRKPRAAMKDLLKQLSVIVDSSDSLDLRIFPQPVG